MAETDATTTLNASVVSTASQFNSQDKFSPAASHNSFTELVTIKDLANELADSEEEEVTTAEFSVDLTDGQTWAINFYECAAEGDLECLEEIIESGHVNVNDVDVDGFTALMVAAAEGHRDVVHALLRRGADVNIRTHELRSTALHFAAKNGDAEIIAALCESDARVVDAWNINTDTPLIWACIEGRAEAVKVLLEYGADVDVLNQHGASTLLCAVMIGEEPDQDAGSDDKRAGIVSMLLKKNSKLINFQDREGSTAMHLAASCGYLECVKTLLAFGADITLRNVMGQTPLEEAQDSHVRESLPCVEHLRRVWRQLEEEAATRMMAMLEMEEEAGKSATGTGHVAGSKKNKKKNKKAKRKASKSHQQPHESDLDADLAKEETTINVVKFLGNEENRASSSEEKDTSRRASVKSPDQNSDEENEERIDVSDTVQIMDGDPTEGLDALASTNAWTTVGKKHRSAIPTVTSSLVKSSTFIPQETALSPTTQQKSTTTSFFQSATHQWTNRQSSNAYESSGERATPESVVARTSTRRSWKSKNSIHTTSSILDPNAPVFKSHEVTNESTSSSEPNANRLSHSPLMQTSPWQPNDGSLRATASCNPASSSVASTRVHYSSSSGRLQWKHQHLNSHRRVVNEVRDRWLSKLRLSNDNVTETLGYLACGLCGELVHDNLQCSGGTSGSSGKKAVLACTQLYCASCLESAALQMANSTMFKCIRCHEVIAKDSMTRNSLAQAQAASLGLSMSHLTTADESTCYSLEDMQQLLESSESRVSAVDLQVVHLLPGMDLSMLSNGQLEVLESIHQLGLGQTVEQRLSNARGLERLRMEEWLKMQRSVLNFTTR
ncbi:putative ankyrin repeat-containing domain-containing protein [Plasmopara halstedii]